jgi:hypothetical protein
METSLPDLPYVQHGNAVLIAGFHSAVKTSPPTYPKTDLETFTPWTSFLDDVHQAIQSAAAAANLPPIFTVGTGGRDRHVGNEEVIRSHAMVALHEPVEDVVNRLGVTGRFVVAGSGNPAIIASAASISFSKGWKR